MNRKLLLSGISLIILAIAIGTIQFAVAQEQEEIVDIGLQFGSDTVAMGISGAIAGAILSVSRVIGKSLKDRKEPMDPKLLGINLLIGAVIGIAGAQIGIENAEIIGTQFMALYVINQVIRPMFGKWIQGKKQTESLQKKSGQD